MSNNAISKTDIENISEHVHDGNVVVEFISLNNDSSTRKNDNLGVKENGINYNSRDPPSQNLAENCVDVEFISQHIDNSEHLLSNNAISEADIENISDKIDDGNVGVEFISLHNDSTTRKNEKMGENKNVANTCIDVTDQSFIKHGIYPPTAVNMLPYRLVIAKDQTSGIGGTHISCM